MANRQSGAAIAERPGLLQNVVDAEDLNSVEEMKAFYTGTRTEYSVRGPTALG